MIYFSISGSFSEDKNAAILPLILDKVPVFQGNDWLNEKSRCSLLFFLEVLVYANESLRAYFANTRVKSN